MSAHLARLERAGPLHNGPVLRVYSGPVGAGRMIVGKRSGTRTGVSCAQGASPCEGLTA